MAESSSPAVQEQRSDSTLRQIFTEAFTLVSPYMQQDGHWTSMAHEYMAREALTQRFPKLTDVKLFAVLSTISGVKSSGRIPVD